jgi:hypothetical protein
MRWFIEVSRVGESTETEKYCLEAKQWQSALQEARKLRGDSGPLSKFSIELLDDGYRAVDPTLKIRYLVAKAPHDAPLSADDQPARAVEPPPRTEPMASPEPLASSPESAPKTDPMGAPVPSAPLASSPPGEQTVRTAPRSHTPAPPKLVVPEDFVPPPPPLPAESRQVVEAARSAPPTAPATTPSHATQRSIEAARAPDFQLIRKREEEPTPQSPITYREYAYAVKRGTDRQSAEILLWSRFRDLEAALSERASGKFVQLAIFDHVFERKPVRPPIATLAWKDWRGEPVLQFPTSTDESVPPPPPSSLSAPPAAAPSAPPPAAAPSAPPPAAVSSAPPPAAVSSAPPPAAVSSSPPAAASSGAPPPQAFPSAPPAALPSAPPIASLPSAPPAAAAAPSAPPAAAAAPSAPPAAAAAPSAPPAAAAAPSAPPAAAAAPSAPPAAAAAPSAPPAAAAAPSAPSAPPQTQPAGVGAGAPASLATAPPEQPPGPRRRKPGEDLIGELFEAMHDLHFVTDVVSGAQFVLAILQQMLPSEGVLVHVFDINTRHFVVLRAAGPNARKVLLHRTPDKEALFVDAMRRTRCVRFDGARGQAHFEGGRWAVLGVTPESVLCGPVQQGGRYLGAIEVANPRGGGPYHESEANALDYICEQFADFVAARPIVIDADVVLATR